MAISDVQAGRIGEYLLAVYAMLTSEGKLVPFQVDADDDHRDLVVAVKGKGEFRIETKDLGPRLLRIIASLPPSTKPVAGARLVMTTR